MYCIDDILCWNRLQAILRCTQRIWSVSVFVIARKFWPNRVRIGVVEFVDDFLDFLSTASRIRNHKQINSHTKFASLFSSFKPTKLRFLFFFHCAFFWFALSCFTQFTPFAFSVSPNNRKKNSQTIFFSLKIFIARCWTFYALWIILCTADFACFGQSIQFRDTLKWVFFLAGCVCESVSWIHGIARARERTKWIFFSTLI